MGASLSSQTEGTNRTGMGPGLGDIPEGCLACVFMNLTPPEICNLARLNRAFRGAASSDSIWLKKLPTNYQDLLNLLPPERYQNLSKKDIFALLSRPVPFDDGYKVGHYRSLFVFFPLNFFRPVPFDYCFKYLNIFLFKWFSFFGWFSCFIIIRWASEDYWRLNMGWCRKYGWTEWQAGYA